ncbi:MAG: alpha/beta fold hydrolase [Anaerolineales bacterium]
MNAGDQFSLDHRWFETKTAGGSPVLLLHGLGSSGQDWLPQLAVLRQRWPILVVDFPGHGTSPPLDKSTTIGEISESLVQLMDVHDQGPFHVVGLSLGALVGLQLALKHPERVQSLLLVNGFARFRSSVRGSIHALGRGALLLADRMDWLGRWVARSVFPEPGQAGLRRMAAERIAAVDQRTYWYLIRAIAAFDVRESLSDLKIPVLVVAGERDRVVSAGCKRELDQGIPSASLRVFPASGHGTPIDSAAEFNDVLVAWLRRHEPPVNQAQ